MDEIRDPDPEPQKKVWDLNLTKDPLKLYQFSWIPRSLDSDPRQQKNLTNLWKGM